MDSYSGTTTQYYNEDKGKWMRKTIIVENEVTVSVPCWSVRETFFGNFTFNSMILLIPYATIVSTSHTRSNGFMQCYDNAISTTKGNGRKDYRALKSSYRDIHRKQLSTPWFFSSRKPRSFQRNKKRFWERRNQRQTMTTAKRATTNDVDSCAESAPLSERWK